VRRRKFIGLAGTGLLASLAPKELLEKPGRKETVDEVYRRSFAIDAQCFGAAPPRTYVPYLTDDKIETLRGSGITALSMCMTVAADRRIESEYLATRDVIEKWDAFVARHADVFLKVISAADLETAKRSGRVGFIYNFQNTTPFGWNLGKLKSFVDLGVRQIQLCHDRRNFVADSGRETTNTGLSRFGKEVVEALNSYGVVIDLSHAGDRSGREAISLSKTPIIFSHSGCYALCPHPRNVSDANIRLAAESGGVFCVYNQSAWLTKDPVISMDHYLAHINHVIKIGGEDHVGMGTDGDAVDMTAMRPDEVERHQRAFDEDVKVFPQLTWKVKHMRVPELSHPKRLLHLAQALDRRGYKTVTIEKILGGNYARVFREVVG
jgi:membrane dipeptidase